MARKCHRGGLFRSFLRAGGPLPGELEPKLSSLRPIAQRWLDWKKGSSAKQKMRTGGAVAIRQPTDTSRRPAFSPRSRNAETFPTTHGFARHPLERALVSDGGAWEGRLMQPHDAEPPRRGGLRSSLAKIGCWALLLAACSSSDEAPTPPGAAGQEGSAAQAGQGGSGGSKAGTGGSGGSGSLKAGAGGTGGGAKAGAGGSGPKGGEGGAAGSGGTSAGASSGGGQAGTSTAGTGGAAGEAGAAGSGEAGAAGSGGEAGQGGSMAAGGAGAGGSAGSAGGAVAGGGQGGGAGEGGQGGAGASGCDPGFHLCGGECANDTSPETCGASCTPCPANPAANEVATCQSGACATACAKGFTSCAGGCVGDQTLLTDPSNCGQCGKACDSGVCFGGSCAVVLASGQKFPYGIATDGVNVYWTNDGEDSVVSVPVGGGAPKVLATAQPGVAFLATDGAHVYWANEGTAANDWADGSVVKAPVGGGPLVTLATQQSHAGAIAVDAQDVYWTTTDPGRVRKVALGGGAPVDVATKSAPFSIALQGSNVFYSSGSSVGYAPKAGGVVTTLSSGYPRGVATDATNLYWANTGDIGKVFAVPLGGGGRFEVATGMVKPLFVATDGKAVYVTDEGANSVVRGSLSGGTVTLAKAQGGPRGIAVDATNVYWANYASGTILKLAK
jgi:hypothetical protein